MPDLNNTSTPITANGDYTFETVPGNRYTIHLPWTGGSAGTITIKDHAGGAYRNADDSADLGVDYGETIDKHVVRATGRQITLTAAAFAGSPSVAHHVTNLGR